MELDPLQNILMCCDMLANKAIPARGTKCPYMKWLQTIGEADFASEIQAELERDRIKNGGG